MLNLNLIKRLVILYLVFFTEMFAWLWCTCWHEQRKTKVFIKQFKRIVCQCKYFTLIRFAIIKMSTIVQLFWKIIIDEILIQSASDAF